MPGHVREDNPGDGAESRWNPRRTSVTIELLQLSDEGQTEMAMMRQLDLPHELFGSSDELLGITVVPLDDAPYVLCSFIAIP
jgi:hypothetical protein